MRSQEEHIVKCMSASDKEVAVVPNSFWNEMFLCCFEGRGWESKDDLTNRAAACAFYLAGNSGSCMGHWYCNTSKRNMVLAGQIQFLVGLPGQERGWVSGAHTGLRAWMSKHSGTVEEHLYRMHYQINTTKTISGRQSMKVSKAMVRVVSITRETPLARRALAMVGAWCVQNPLDSLEPLLSQLRTNLYGVRRGGKYALAPMTRMRPNQHGQVVEMMYRGLQYADVSKALKMVIVREACGYMDPANYTLKTVRRWFAAVARDVATREEALALA